MLNLAFLKAFDSSASTSHFDYFCARAAAEKKVQKSNRGRRARGGRRSSHGIPESPFSPPGFCFLFLRTANISRILAAFGKLLLIPFKLLLNVFLSREFVKVFERPPCGVALFVTLVNELFPDGTDRVERGLFL